jgi:hypothetical protein
MNPIEYASLSRRTEARGQISSAQRQRLTLLRDLEINHGDDLPLSAAEREELRYLEWLNGTGPAPTSIPAWVVEGTAPTRSAAAGNRRRMSGRMAMLQTLAMKYPHRPISGRQAICQLWAERMLWDLPTQRHRELWRLRQSWS